MSSLKVMNTLFVQILRFQKCTCTCSSRVCLSKSLDVNIFQIETVIYPRLMSHQTISKWLLGVFQPLPVSSTTWNFFTSPKQQAFSIQMTPRRYRYSDKFHCCIHLAVLVKNPTSFSVFHSHVNVNQLSITQQKFSRNLPSILPP